MTIDWESIVVDETTGKMTMSCATCGESVNNMADTHITAWVGEPEVSDDYLLHPACATNEQIDTYLRWAGGEA